ncbi:MAG: helix-turn-helix domain-containing protein [candidate division WOR-3 bacterium]|nr:helix-turn-helix domain-containing protein [candidate division WOR-3 bacterium]MCX7757354.1 helix-turn-helix domain-containing protein [candidate division WOR-3 bacterium]MDW7987480.1 helix-turn-helix domain-containing protein [candidate division WOR-3 bacterium]
MNKKNYGNSFPDKTAERFYTLSEVSKITKISSQTIKYWQKAYKIHLKKNKSGKYLYTQDDINKILLIKQLRLRDKLSLAGVKKRLSQFSKHSFNEIFAGKVVDKTINNSDIVALIQKELIIIKGLLEQIISDISNKG